jgi:hypothetical protein
MNVKAAARQRVEAFVARHGIAALMAGGPPALASAIGGLSEQEMKDRIVIVVRFCFAIPWAESTRRRGECRNEMLARAIELAENWPPGLPCPAARMGLLD